MKGVERRWCERRRPGMWKASMRWREEEGCGRIEI